MIGWIRFGVRRLARWFRPAKRSQNLHRGERGEAAARRFLETRGLKCLACNVRTHRGEIDLVCRDGDCLVFVEVKARSQASWTRPAAAVDIRKRERLSRAAFDYLRMLPDTRVKFRFDIVEVGLEGDEVREVQHLPNSFTLTGSRAHWG